MRDGKPAVELRIQDDGVLCLIHNACVVLMKDKEDGETRPVPGFRMGMSELRKTITGMRKAMELYAKRIDNGSDDDDELDND